MPFRSTRPANAASAALPRAISPCEREACQSGRRVPAKAMMSNLQLRVISATILALIVLTITFWGGFPSRLLVSVVAVAMLYEWISMDRIGIDRRLTVVAFAGLILSLLAMVLAF